MLICARLRPKRAIKRDDDHVLALLVDMGDFVLSHDFSLLGDETFQRITTFNFYLIEMDMYAA